MHDVDNAQHILSGAVLPVYPDDERAARSREVPGGKWPERARYDYVLDGDTERRSRTAQKVRPIERSELPRRGSRSANYAWSAGSSGADRLSTAPPTAGDAQNFASRARSRTATCDSVSSPVRSTSPVTKTIRGPMTSSRR